MRTRRLKIASILVILLILNEILFPVGVYALTSGPTQPEVHGFEPVGTNQMVDLFSGDFTYNIPLMDVGGYPINMAYHAGIGMEDEASWVGLGWSLTPGAINRSMRGLPDDFKGEEIKIEQNLKDNTTIGVRGSITGEVFGFELPLTLGGGIYSNSYRGVGVSTKIGIQKEIGNFNVSASFGFDSQNGNNANIGLSYDQILKSQDNNNKDGKKESSTTASLTPSLNVGFNSQSGLSQLSFGASLGANVESVKDKEGKVKYSGRNGGSGSIGMASGSIPLGYNTYSPSISMSMYNANFSLSYAGGFELFGGHAQGEVQGYFSAQWLASKEESTPAYGYLYGQHINDPENTLMDFNRESDYPYSEGIPHLALAQNTFDVFSISGQGAGGMFRPYRNDIPVVGDPIHWNKTDLDRAKGAEYGPGNLQRGGFNATVAGAEMHAGIWPADEGNKLKDIAGYGYGNTDGDFYENVFMRMGGEMTPLDPVIFTQRGGFNPVRLGITNRNLVGDSDPWSVVKNFRKLDVHGRFETNSILFNDDGTINTILNDDQTISNRKYPRQRRSSTIYYKTNEEAGRSGFEKLNESYNDIKVNNRYILDSAKNSYKKFQGPRTDLEARKGHHIGEITVLRADGMRYIYGIPVYNNQSIEVSFAIGDKKDQSCADNGLVHYTQNDASLENSHGKDNYFQKKTTPAYATAYLLTAVLSPDYIDVGGDGISPDDLGTAVKFNYHLSTTDFGWRTPYQKDSARYSHGLSPIKDDAKANYTYGTKEIWYLHSIESKTHIAEFYTSARKDGLGVSDERGTKDQDTLNRLRKLDRILLYTKNDRQDNLANQTDPTFSTNLSDDEPIKTVYFEYDYSVCDGVPNWASESATSKGKLTLKKIRFAYGKSMKAMLSPYVFTYDTGSNYNSIHMDRWGSYKPNDCEKPNRHFPYSVQDTAQARENASSWHLTKIKLPSGGTIQVNYEPDDYAYVMDKKAMQMVDIVGTGNTPYFKPEFHGNTGTLYDMGTGEVNNYLYFKLTTPVSSSNELKHLYMPENKVLFHKCRVYIKGENDPQIIPGYAEIEQMGLVPNRPNYGYVKVKQEEIIGKGIVVNPISKNAWDFIKNYMSEKVYSIKHKTDGDKGSAIKSLLSAAGGIVSTFLGPHMKMWSNSNAATIDLAQSVIRLNVPNGQKLGGGVRVRNVKMTDNWGDVTNGATGQYGMAYDYTMDNPDTLSSVPTISSGVTPYEPSIGNDENPFKVPLYYDIFKNPTLKFLGKQELKMEGPLAESFFPSPSVGYAKVTVKSLATRDGDGGGTGYSINEFFTAKDFPVKVEFTEILPDKKRRNIPLGLLSRSKSERHSATQGYVVQTNDMHGKQKATWAYDENNTRISGSQYQYLGKNKQLHNTVKTLSKDGTIESKILGVTDDIIIDTRSVTNKVWSNGVNFNLDAFLILGIPAAVPTFFRPLIKQKTSLRTVSITKVIQRAGILESVTAYDEQSSVKSTNLLWDDETGDVLYTQTSNEFEDPLYNFKLPAHYAYDGMGPAYKNINLIWYDAKISRGLYINPTSVPPSRLFAPGDELSLVHEDYQINNIFSNPPGIDTTRSVRTAFVKDVSENFAFIIDQRGKPVNGRFVSMKIVRSGRRNLLNESVGSFTSNEKIDLNASSYADPTNVLQTGVSEFSDEWPVYCDQLRVRKCTLNQDIAGPFVNTLNRLVDERWFDTLVNYQASGDTIGYIMDDFTEFNGTGLHEQAKKHTWFLKCTAETCSTTEEIDSLITFNVVNDSGYVLPFQYYGTRTLLHPKLYNYPWKEFVSSEPIMRIKANCCLGDTGYYNRVDYNRTHSGWVDDSVHLSFSHHFNFGYVPTLNGNKSDYGCKVVLHNFLWHDITLDEIDSFGNMRPHSFMDLDNYFLIDIYSGGEAYTFEIYTGNCYPMRECWYECESNVGDTINPYITGARGIWRKKLDKVYHNDRSHTELTAYKKQNTFIRKDGDFAFSPYWEFNSTDTLLEKDPSSSYLWISPAEIVHFSPHGNELEIQDALGRYSCEIYGYNRKLVVAVANNAVHHNVAFDGFEDYDFPYHTECRKEAHWALQEFQDGYQNHASEFNSDPGMYRIGPAALNPDIDFTQSHTGRASLYVPKNNYLSTTDSFKSNDTNTFNRNKIEVFRIEASNCIGHFAPEVGKKYILSAWVKQDYTSGYEDWENHDEAYLDITVGGSTYNAQFYPDGPMIEGWQRIYGEFTIPDTATSGLTVKVVCSNFTGTGAYFDDIRIQPFNSNMKSYVYDPLTLRLSAELDENNFATFYDYDTEGRLTRIRKETESGIVTLQESRYGVPKQ